MLFLKHDLNVFITDWEKGAMFPYYSNAVHNVKYVGERQAEFINNNKLINIHWY